MTLTLHQYSVPQEAPIVESSVRHRPRSGSTAPCPAMRITIENPEQKFSLAINPSSKFTGSLRPQIADNDTYTTRSNAFTLRQQHATSE